MLMLALWKREGVFAAYQQQYADNQNISFLPAIVSTSCRMHGEFLRLIFVQAHRETEAHFNAAGMSSQNYQTDAFRFKRAAFLLSLRIGKSRGNLRNDIRRGRQPST